MGITEYTTFEDGNIGGIACDSITLIALPDIVSQTNTSVVYSKATQIYFTEGTSAHNEAQKSDVQGELWEQSISFNVPKNRTEIRDWLTANHRKYFYVQYIDKNGYAIEIPKTKLKSKYTTGRQARDRNEFEFSFEGDTLKPARQARALLLPAIISVSPTTLNFGNVEVGYNKKLNFTINNTGASNLIVSSINLPANCIANWTSGTIAPTGSQIVTITFAPSTSGFFNGNIIVNSNAVSGTNAVSVIASVLPSSAGYLDGSNDYFEADRPTLSDFTVALTYVNRSNNSGFKAFIATENYSSAKTGDGIALYLRNNNFEFWTKIGGTSLNEFTTPQPTPNLNTLHHVVLQRQGTTIRLYLNGALAVTDTTGSLNDISPKFNLGDIPGHGLTNLPSVNYEDIKIYNRVLSAVEILDLYNKEEITSGLVYDCGFTNISKVGPDLFITAKVGNNMKAIGYPTGAKLIVNPLTNADIQTAL